MRIGTHWGRIAAAVACRLESFMNLRRQDRAHVMYRFKKLLEQNAEKIAALITEEHGKVLDDAMGGLQRGIEVVEYPCAAPEFLKREHAKYVGPAIDSWSLLCELVATASIINRSD
jgi:malonate-semialdehyde dehydrogenase (acetylating) / methylmalonate-semialdehyde dehydrogenase